MGGKHQFYLNVASALLREFTLLGMSFLFLLHTSGFILLTNEKEVTWKLSWKRKFYFNVATSVANKCAHQIFFTVFSKYWKCGLGRYFDFFQQKWFSGSYNKRRLWSNESFQTQRRLSKLTKPHKRLVHLKKYNNHTESIIWLFLSCFFLCLKMCILKVFFNLIDLFKRNYNVWSLETF